MAEAALAMAQKPRILVADPIAPAGLDLLRAAADVDIRPGLSADELIACIGDYDALVTRSETKATAAVIAAGSRLRVIGRAGVGVDNIDVNAATEAGILVVNVPGANTIAAAEHTLGLMLALARHIPQAHADLRGGQWRRGRFTGAELQGKTLAVLGLGRIGTEVAVRARAFGMRVIAYDPYVSAERAALHGIELGGLEDVLRQADYVTLHMAKTPETVNLLGAAQLDLLPRGARVINCARGGLIDEEALAERLQDGRLGGAALDVFAVEPPPPDYPLLQLDNVIVTPHLAGSTAEAQENNGLIIAELVLAALRGEPVLSAVNLPSIPAEEARALAPYLQLADVLGRFAAQAWPGAVRKVGVAVAGDVAAGSLSLLSSAALAGLIDGHLSEPVNVINARAVARKRGITVAESADTEDASHTNRLTLTIEVGGETVSVAGYVTPSGPRIIGIGGYQTDFAPARYMVLVHHTDQPGMIGRVGSLLGEQDINIASMQVARYRPRGEAFMILMVDEDPGQRALETIRAIDGVVTARLIHLPGMNGANGG